MFNSGQYTIWKNMHMIMILQKVFQPKSKYGRIMDLTLNIINNGQVQYVSSIVSLLYLYWHLLFNWNYEQILKWEREHTWFLTHCSSIVEGLAGYKKPTCVNSILHVLISVPLSGNQSTLNTLRNDDWTPFSQSDSKCSITSPELPIHQITSHKAAFVWSVPRSYNSLM